MPKAAAAVLVLLLAPAGALGGAPQAQNGPSAGKKAQDPTRGQRGTNVKNDAAADDETFSEQVSDQVLRNIADGLEAHDSRLLLSAFDARKMAGYRAFRDQVDALFQRYERFRVHYSVVQTAQEGERGIVLANWEMEETPSYGVAPPLLRRGQIRFVLAHAAKGWKVVDLQPRGMFAE